MRAHTITTKAIPGGILALSLAVALLAATASSASSAPGNPPVSVALATWNCPPPSTPLTTADQLAGCFGSPALGRFNFGTHLVGTSTSQRFALGVIGDTFNPTISVSGDYAQTNNCPPTLSAGPDEIDGCLITVSFSPAGELYGPRPGTLTTGPGGPTMALTGNGEPRDSVPPDLKLSGPKRQDPQNDIFTDGDGANVVSKVSCGDEWCTARTTGKLTNVKMDKLTPEGPLDIEPRQTIGPRRLTRPVKMGPELTRKSQRREVSKALAEGEKVEAKVTVRVKDLSGNVATVKRTIRLVKRVRGA